MQIEISFAAAYDFNQYTKYVPRPGRPLPAPQILTPSPHTKGRGGFPAPPRPIDFWPCPAPPRLNKWKKPLQSISATDAKHFIPTETSLWQTANLVSTIIDHHHIVKLSIRRVEEMGSGAAYCQLMDLLYPGEDNVTIIMSHDMISK